MTRHVVKLAKERGQRLHARSLRHHLYATKFIERLPDARERPHLRRGLADFVGNEEVAGQLFDDLQAAIIKRSPASDAVGSATVAIGERIDVLATKLEASAEDSARWQERLSRMRKYRAMVAREIVNDWPDMRRLVAAMDSPDRDEVLRDWSHTVPKYLENAPPIAHAWVGDLAADIGVTQTAGKFFDRAIEGGAHPVGFWAARRSLLEGMERGLDLDPYDHPLAVAIRNEYEGNAAGAIEAIRTWTPRTINEEVYRDAVLSRSNYLNRDYERAIQIGNRGRQRGSTAATLWWARALMAREVFSGSGLYKGDTALALAGLVQHRDDLRTLRHKAGEIVSTAATAARLLNDLERAISLTTTRPVGEATEEEANDLMVRVAGAIMLGQNGDTERALTLVDDPGISTSERSELSALIARKNGHLHKEIDHTVKALDATEDQELKGRLAYNLSLHGVEHPFLDEQESLGNLVFSKQLRLVAAAIRDEPGAIETLKAEALGSQNLSVSLAEVYARRDDPAAELKALENAAALGNDADLWMEVGRRQFLDRQLVSAEASMAAAITAAGPEWGAVHRARALQVEVAAALENWPSAIVFAEALVRTRPDDVRVAWTLIACLYFGAEVERAIEVWRSHGEPTPETRQDVAIWVGFCQSVPSFGTMTELHRLAKKWTDDEEIRRNIVGLVVLPPKEAAHPVAEEGDDEEVDGALVDPDDQLRAEVLNDYFRDFPEGGIRQLTINLESESILDEIRAAVGEQPDTRLLDDQVFSGAVPLGMSSMIHGGSYVETVVSCSSGIRFVGYSRDSTTSVKDLVGAAQVVADTSAIYALTRLPSRLSTRLMSVISTLHVSDVQYRDAVRGLNQISRFGHAGPNVRNVRGKVARRLRPDSGTGDREAAGQIVAAMRRYRRLPPVPGFDAQFPGEGFDSAPWFGAVAAAGTGQILWADDSALCGAANALHMQTFTTLDLVRALRSEERLTEDDERQIHSLLLRDRVAGIPFDVRTYSAAFIPTAAVATAIAGLFEHEVVGNANEIFEFMIAGAGALSSQQFLLEMWLSATVRWLMKTAPDDSGAEDNLRVLARRVFDCVWLVRTTFPFVEMGVTDGLDDSDQPNPLIAEALRRFRLRALADHAGAARELLDLTAGVEPARRVEYTRIALS